MHVFYSSFNRSEYCFSYLMYVTLINIHHKIYYLQFYSSKENLDISEITNCMYHVTALKCKVLQVRRRYAFKSYIEIKLDKFRKIKK